MESGTYVLPHAGPTNMRLRAHLGLRIPRSEDKNNSYLRVADQILHWEDGKMIIFDDSFEHEVWHYNERNESRLLLYFDFWHPDLRPEQRFWRPMQFDAYGNLQ